MTSIPTLFCNSLRRRSSFASAIAKLQQQSRFVVREQVLITHDIAVPIKVEVDPGSGSTYPTRHIRFLLLSLSGVANDKFETTIERIRHFSSLTNEPIAIIFLLNPPRDTSFQIAKHFDKTANDQAIEEAGGIIAYTKLQAEMMNLSDLPHIPVLLLNKVDGLEALLSKHAALHMNHKPGQQQRGAATSRELMQLCTLRQPMQEFTANVLSDTFDNLQDLSRAMVSARNEPKPNSSSPTAIAAFALSVLSQDWDEYGNPLGSCDDVTPQGKLRTLKAIIDDEVEVSELVYFWQEDFQI